MKLLKTLALSLPLALSFTVSTGANAKPKKEINLQNAMVDQCVAEFLHFKVANKATAKKVCKCTTNVQAKYLKLGEFWEMQSYAMNGRSPHALPAVQRIKPKLQACRKGVKLNPPTVPKPKK